MPESNLMKKVEEAAEVERLLRLLAAKEVGMQLRPYYEREPGYFILGSTAHAGKGIWQKQQWGFD